jgi:S-formylglutathione hydrolase FrmB
MRSLAALVFTLILLPAGCHRPAPLKADHPRLNANVRMTDTTLHSAILHRDMPIRLVAPTKLTPNMPIVYLLHGAGEDYRNWTNESNIAELAASGVLLAMPEGGNTYYINDAAGVRYEDFFFTELVPEVHRRYPNAATDRTRTAIAGISRGGFAATLYALKHPEMFGYVAGLSSALDLAERKFRWHAPLESLQYRKVFGPVGSPTRLDNDPYVLLRKLPAEQSPIFALTCGDKDVLLPSNISFDALLVERNLPHTFAVLQGDHNWSLWEPQIAGLQRDLLTYFKIPTSTPQP